MLGDAPFEVPETTRTDDKHDGLIEVDNVWAHITSEVSDISRTREMLGALTQYHMPTVLSMPSLTLDRNIQVRALQEAGSLADEDIRQGLTLCRT